MVFRHISTDIKERALWLRGQGYIDDEIAHLLGVSTRSIRRWNENINIFGSVIPQHHLIQGRPSEVTTELRENLITLVAESPELFLDEIQEWITIAHDIALSRSRLCEILQDCSLSYKRIRRAAAERDEELINNWREAYQQAYTASQLLWIDETNRYSFVAALGLDGYAAMRVVPGSVDSGEFWDFVVDDVLPTMNPFPGDRSVIIMDNCRIHKSETLRELVESFGM
ncbi:hypothetical protein F5878DRAFT_526676 [Lentinula raphanica]|uniref:Tc1-like transposase DDE domain-containing protein n=1 Tax=Lentinula raphanica TaxID=153919 RepID=A0AA38PJA3_9AGAR|nr:hypothetical protein F5878DRAFT_526676 [Lentinula raphanica]